MNQELDLGSIEWFGMDFDHTLAAYKPSLGETIYDLAKQQLMTARQYPESLQSLRYDPNFAVRGVAYDTRRGFLLKLDFLHAARADNSYFGRRQMTEAEVVAAYGSLVVSGTELAGFRPLVDLFCLPEACLISDVIQHFVNRGTPFHPAYVYSDVKSAVGYLHESVRRYRAPRTLRRTLTSSRNAGTLSLGHPAQHHLRLAGAVHRGGP